MDELQADTAVDSASIISLLAAVVRGYSNGQSQPVAVEQLPHTLEANQSEAAGCCLWDLAAGEAAAAVLLHSGLLDVSEAVLESELSASQSSACSHRMVEIMVGVLGNVATHPALTSGLASREGLASLVVNGVLWLTEEAPCLTEACRLLAAVVRAETCKAWLEPLAQPAIVRHILWLADNTLNTALLERTWELLASLLRVRQGGLVAQLLDAGVVDALAAVLRLGAIAAAKASGGGAFSTAAMAGASADDGADGWAMSDADGDTAVDGVEHGGGVPAGADDPADSPAAPAHAHVSEGALDAALRAVEELLSAPGAGPAVVGAHGELLAALLELLRNSDESSPLLEPLVMIMAQVKAAVLASAAAAAAPPPAPAQSPLHTLLSPPPPPHSAAASPAAARWDGERRGVAAAAAAGGLDSLWASRPMTGLVTGWLLERLLCVVFECGPHSAGAQAGWFLSAALLGRAALEQQEAPEGRAGWDGAPAFHGNSAGPAAAAAAVAADASASASPAAELSPLGGLRGSSPTAAAAVVSGGGGPLLHPAGGGEVPEGCVLGGVGRLEAEAAVEGVGRLLEVLGRMQRLQVGEGCAEYAAMCGTNALALLSTLEDGRMVAGVWAGTGRQRWTVAVSALKSWHTAVQGGAGGMSGED